MQDLFYIVTYPLKRIADLLFSLTTGGTSSSSIGSIIVVGVAFSVLIGAIMHASGHGIGSIVTRIRDRKK